MRRIPALPRSACRLAVVGFVLVAVPLMSGCDFLDDIQGWNKKALPGDRKPLFPEGVPGVSSGLPPDLAEGLPRNLGASTRSSRGRGRSRSGRECPEVKTQSDDSAAARRYADAARRPLRVATSGCGQAGEDRRPIRTANSSAPPRKTAKPAEQSDGTRQAAAPSSASASQPQSAPSTLALPAAGDMARQFGHRCALRRCPQRFAGILQDHCL